MRWCAAASPSDPERAVHGIARTAAANSAQGGEPEVRARPGAARPRDRVRLPANRFDLARRGEERFFSVVVHARRLAVGRMASDRLSGDHHDSRATRPPRVHANSAPCKP